MAPIEKRLAAGSGIAVCLHAQNPARFEGAIVVFPDERSGKPVRIRRLFLIAP